MTFIPVLEAGLRRLQIQADTTTVSFACSESIDAAEYHVMVKSGKDLFLTKHFPVFSL